jgi:hypothetical protein
MRLSTFVLVSGVVLAGCKSGTAVLVTVSAMPSLSPVVRLHATATAAGQTKQFDVPLSHTMLPPAVSFAIDVPPSVQGMLSVKVDAVSTQSTTLASATGSTSLAAGQRETIAITLGTTIAADMTTPTTPTGVDGGDMGGGGTGGDMATGADMPNGGDMVTRPVLKAPNFTSGGVFAAEGTVTSLAVADFNGDTNPDVALYSNDGNSTVKLKPRVAIGDGKGKFSAFWTCNSPSGKTMAAVGAGIVGANLVMGTVTANTDGTFSPYYASNSGGYFTYNTDITAVTGAGATSQSIAMGLLSASAESWVLVGTNNGLIAFSQLSDNFSSPSAYLSGTDVGAIAISSFAGNAAPDVVALSPSGKVANVLLNGGQGQLGLPKASTTGGNPVAVATGDFNGGGQDFVVATVSPSEVEIFLNDGKGKFGTMANHYSVPATPNGIAVGDFNGDGKLDIAVVSDAANQVNILSGYGDGSFNDPTPFAVEVTGGFGGAKSIGVGDFNGDHLTDIVVGSGLGFQLLLNSPM